MKIGIGGKTADFDLEDALFVAFTPLLILLIYLLPRSLKQALIFRYTEPGLIQAYTTHFVHIKLWHFAGNLVIAALTVFILYETFSLIGKKKEFRRLYLVLILVLPWVITAIDYTIIEVTDIGFTRVLGFSAVNMALIGVIPLTIFEYIHKSTDGRIHRGNSIYLFYFGISLILLSLLRLVGRYNLSISPALFYGIIALIPLFIAYADYRLLNAIEKAGLSIRGLIESIDSGWNTWIITLIIIYFLGAGLAVPSKLVHSSGFVNFLSHITGFILGYYSARITMWYHA